MLASPVIVIGCRAMMLASPAIVVGSRAMKPASPAIVLGCQAMYLPITHDVATPPRERTPRTGDRKTASDEAKSRLLDRVPPPWVDRADMVLSNTSGEGPPKHAGNRG